MKDVVYNRHAANIFLAFLLCRSNYTELGLWMELHYNFFPLLKGTTYPDSISDVISYISIHPNFFKEVDDVGILSHSNYRINVLKKQRSSYANVLLLLKLKAFSNPNPTLIIHLQPISHYHPL